MVAEEVAFWNDYVLTKTPPPTDGHKATTAALKLLHPLDSGAEIELPTDEWGAKLDRLERIKAAQKRLNEQSAVLENELKSVIQSATYAHVGDKTVSWKTQTRKAYEVKESTSRVMRIGKRKQERKAK
jgi:predicted phage-related endonuclease